MRGYAWREPPTWLNLTQWDFVRFNTSQNPKDISEFITLDLTSLFSPLHKTQVQGVPHLHLVEGGKATLSC